MGEKIVGHEVVWLEEKENYAGLTTESSKIFNDLKRRFKNDSFTWKCLVTQKMT